MTTLTSRDNPRVRRWAKLTQDSRFRREEKKALIEGPHLVEAFLDSGGTPLALLATESGLAKPEISQLLQRANHQPLVVSEAVFQSVVDSETPQGIAAEIALPDRLPNLEQAQACVFMEGIQDAGNVGTILRSALAFGIRDIVLAKGCADVWSPKVLRAAAGAHFHLGIADHVELAGMLERFGGRLVCTVPRRGTPLPRADLRGRIGWIFGGEGRGISPEVMQRAHLNVSIPMSTGSESLNVAVAASLCFYEAARTNR
jgi:TrmH family RNA methyltransferase